MNNGKISRKLFQHICPNFLEHASPFYKEGLNTIWKRFEKLFADEAYKKAKKSETQHKADTRKYDEFLAAEAAHH